MDSLFPPLRLLSSRSWYGQLSCTAFAEISDNVLLRQIELKNTICLCDQSTSCPTSADQISEDPFSNKSAILLKKIDKMCHRQLKFIRSTGCGHLTFTGEVNIDCRSRHCYISSSHPANCGSHAPCRCRRYYGQPQRIVTHEVRASYAKREQPPHEALGSWEM